MNSIIFFVSYLLANLLKSLLKQMLYFVDVLGITESCFLPTK